MHDFIKKIVKDFDGAEMGEKIEVRKWVSTGNYALNKIISDDYHKGLPFGRVVEVFGDPSTGKSLLVYHILANVQKMGGIAILDDTEDAYVSEFGAKIGIDNKELIRMSSLTVEEHFEKTFLGWKDSNGKKREALVASILQYEPDCPIVVALDSLALLSTRHEMEVKMEKPDMAKAKQIKAGLRIVSEVMRKSNTLHLISNHVIASMAMFGPRKTTPGGSGVPFQASVRLELSHGKKVEEERNSRQHTIAVNSNAYVAKNKVSAPFKEAEVCIYFDKGIDPCSGLMEQLIMDGTLKDDDKKGRLSYGSESFRKSDFMEFFNTHPEILKPAPKVEISKEKSKEVLTK